uniref:Uncharacterized protein n=1 Tax=Panagrellus redivivus TaxID=6233 RepID=A0A7E4V3D0_PANRE
MFVILSTFMLFVNYFPIIIAQAHDVGREVEGGVQILNTGPIKLVLPDILSFTIKNAVHCKGLFRICYESDPNLSTTELELKYVNVGGRCAPGYCTLKLEPEHNGIFGLAQEDHDGNWYGLFSDSSTSMCPRHVVDSRANFTVINVPNCPVIVDGARLAKEKTAEPKKKSFNIKWIIAICIGLGVLLLVTAFVGLCMCASSKK